MTSLSAYSAYGIELEYMIVNRDSLSVRPIAAKLLKNGSGRIVNELVRKNMVWSNELTLHLIEIKNNPPVPKLLPLVDAFQLEVAEINRQLEVFGACLMPTGMHPWMDPSTETRLWPHDNADIYRTYDSVFGCRQHGFANLQSMHLNLPFQDDAQFARLHAATRLILPILPALAASSPFQGGCSTGFLDNRLKAYCAHQARVPPTMGEVIPDTISSRAECRVRILLPMYEAISSFDPKGALRQEWLNARGAVPRFDRMALEIRLIDMQEYPRADLAVAAVVTALIRWLDEGKVSDLASQQSYPTHHLANLLQACIKDADQASIEDPAYLALLGLPSTPCSAAELWRQLIEDWWQREPEQRKTWNGPLDLILEHGPLSRRILRAVGPNCPGPRQQEVYRSLCNCLSTGHPFVG
ncbi:MAG TPA: glutamate-cysteine ligase family protein [Thiobacillaceae bacterium]|nr:glutamate-cysteine ligase family protein [Thiobacillaceae bacterium]